MKIPIFVLMLTGSLALAQAQAPISEPAHFPTPSTWRFDPAQSDMPKESVPTADELTILKDEPTLFSYKEKEVFPKKVFNISWSGKPDGTMRPIEGGSDGDKMSLYADRTGHQVQHDGVVEDFTLSVSADGKTLTQLADVTMPSGQKIHLKMVYVRIR